MEPSSPKELKMEVTSWERKFIFRDPSLRPSRTPFSSSIRRGVFLKANPKGLEMLGYALGRPSERWSLIDVVALEDFGRVREGFEEIGKGNELRFRIHVDQPSGRSEFLSSFFGSMQDGMFFHYPEGLEREIRERRGMGEDRRRNSSKKFAERDQYARELQALKNLYKEKLKEIEKMREEAVLLSYIDDLTGIYNHRFFIQQLTMEVERQKRYPTPLSLLMIDIDYFKHYNDTNGHLAGDQALRAIAILIQHGVRQTDIVARYGGEEFSAILINAGKEGAMEIAERVRRNVAETHFPNEEPSTQWRFDREYRGGNLFPSHYDPHGFDP